MTSPASTRSSTLSVTRYRSCPAPTVRWKSPSRTPNPVRKYPLATGYPSPRPASSASPCASTRHATPFAKAPGNHPRSHPPLPRSLVMLQRAHELRDGSADFVGAVLLDEVQSGDGGLGEVRPRADEVADAAPDDGAWFGVNEQFGHIAFGQPAAVVVDHRCDVRGLAVDGDVAWPGQ